MAEGKDNAGRDNHGRFAAGNPGGPGGARRRSSELRRAAEEAITIDHIQAMVRKFTRMALEGNLAAARLVFERTCGRAAEPPADSAPLDVVIPRLRTAADCNVAIERLVEALVRGTIDRDMAKVLIDAIQVRLKTIEASDHEQRLAELEQSAAAFEANGANRDHE